MLTYDYPEITDYFGRKVKLDWVEDSEHNEVELPYYKSALQNGAARLLLAYDDANDPSLKHVVKATAAVANQLVLGNGAGATATASQLVMGNGTGITGFLRKLNSSNIAGASTTAVTFTSHFVPERGSFTALLYTPGWYDEFYIARFIRKNATRYDSVSITNDKLHYDTHTETYKEVVYNYTVNLEFTDNQCTLTVSNLKVSEYSLEVNDGTLVRGTVTTPTTGIHHLFDLNSSIFILDV